MPNIPMDVIHDILSRLPVKALLRFRCVSKPWRALIHSRDFVEAHLKRSIETKNNLRIILETSDNIYLVNLGSMEYAIKRDLVMKSRFLETEVLGSCRGLICLCNIHKDVAIWNPATRKCCKFASTKINFKYDDYIIHGFGYDPVTDDYKVVRFIEHYGYDGKKSGSEVQVCSMRSSSWGKIQDFPYYLRFRRHGTLVGSALHWVVTKEPESDNNANLIVAFDLSVEEYRLVPQPDYSNKDFSMAVGAFDECLCIICNYFHGTEVWVMKNYGVEESWSKLLSIGYHELITSFGFVVPLAYSKNGCEILLVQGGIKFIWYDLERKTIKNIRINGLPNGSEMVICVESLIGLEDGEGKKRDGKLKNHIKNEKRRLRKIGLEYLGLH